MAQLPHQVNNKAHKIPPITVNSSNKSDPRIAINNPNRHHQLITPHGDPKPEAPAGYTLPKSEGGSSTTNICNHNRVNSSKIVNQNTQRDPHNWQRKTPNSDRRLFPLVFLVLENRKNGDFQTRKSREMEGMGGEREGKRRNEESWSKS